MNSRRLYLPDGSTFDLPMPTSAGRYQERSDTITGSDGSPCFCSRTYPFLGGLVIGLAITWLLYQISTSR